MLALLGLGLLLLGYIFGGIALWNVDPFFVYAIGLVLSAAVVLGFAGTRAAKKRTNTIPGMMDALGRASARRR